MKRTMLFLAVISLMATACTRSQGNYKEETVFKNRKVEFHKIDEHTWHGNGHLVYNESVYLIEGDSSAILIDAGTYIPGLRKIAEGIVNKPVTLVLSHLHSDHAGIAINEWDTIWYNPDEGIANFAPNKTKMHLADSQLFDLGGRTIEVVFTPGHTPGSVSFIDKEAHYGFSSDAFGSTNLLVTTTLSTELATCQRMSQIIDEYGIKYLYPGHYSGDNLESPQRVKDLATICSGILDGTLQPTSKGNGPLPYVVEMNGVKVNYGDAQIK